MEEVDILRAEGRSRALLMFIHGGYWRSRDKRGGSALRPPAARVPAQVRQAVPGPADPGA
jgi:acetyl esterase/lipase